MRLADLAARDGLTIAEARDRLRVLIDAEARGVNAAAFGEEPRREWTRPDCEEAIRAFVASERREPRKADLVPPRLPSDRTLRRHYGSVSAALSAALVVVEPLRLFDYEAV